MVDHVGVTVIVPMFQWEWSMLIWVALLSLHIVGSIWFFKHCC
jgi:hypothetical protein